MKKIAIKDNKICEVVGLAKKPVNLSKVIPVVDINDYGRLALNLNENSIKKAFIGLMATGFTTRLPLRGLCRDL